MRVVRERVVGGRTLWLRLPRDVLNVLQPDSADGHIVTVTTGIVNKLDLADRDLDELSLDTVKMFRSDAVKAGFTLKESEQPA